MRGGWGADGLRLCLVTDEALSRGRPLERIVAAAVRRRRRLRATARSVWTPAPSSSAPRRSSACWRRWACRW
ncbi:MAG: hypothetical protein MZW92_58550 [Comamonadaceae bacterium]|nr:hypothetical protein [Comamonadaceae bacterium]